MADHTFDGQNVDYRRFHSYAIIQMTTINKFEFEFCVTLRS